MGDVKLDDYKGTPVEKAFGQDSKVSKGRDSGETLGDCIDRLMDEDGMSEEEAEEACAEE